MRVIGADPEGSVYSGGTGRPYLVEGVGEDFWPTAYDGTVVDEIIASLRRRVVRPHPPPRARGGAARRRLQRARRRIRPQGGARRSAADDVMVDPAARRRPRLPRQDLQRQVDALLRLPARRARAARSPTSSAPRTRELPELVHVHPSDTVRAHHRQDARVRHLADAGADRRAAGRDGRGGRLDRREAP